MRRGLVGRPRRVARSVALALVLAAALWVVPGAWAQVFTSLQGGDPADLGTGALISGPYLFPRRTVDRPAVIGKGTVVRGSLVEEYASGLPVGTGVDLRYVGQIRRLEVATGLGSRWHLALRRDRSRIGVRMTGGVPVAADHAADAWSASLGYRPSAKWSVGAALTAPSEWGAVEAGGASAGWSLRPTGWVIEAERQSGSRTSGVRAAWSSGLAHVSGTAAGVGVATRLRAGYGQVELHTMRGDESHARGWLLQYHQVARATSDFAENVGGSRGWADPSLESVALMSVHRERRGQTTVMSEIGAGWVWTRGGADVAVLPVPELFGGHYIVEGGVGGPRLHAAAGFRSEVHKRVALTGGLRTDLWLPRGQLRAIQVATLSRPASVLWDERLAGRLAYSVLPALGFVYHTDSWNVTYSVGWPVAGLTRRPGEPAAPLPAELRLPAAHALVVQYAF